MGSIPAGTTTLASDDRFMNAVPTQSNLDLKSTTKTDSQMVDSMSRSQMPKLFDQSRGFDRAGNQEDQEEYDENGIPNTAAGQARHFYYGTDENEMSIKSQDFDDAYAVSGQSQVLRNMQQSRDPKQASMTNTMRSSGGQKKGNQLTFGKDEDDQSIVDSQH